MAKNKYRAKPRATATGQSSSTGQAPQKKGDGECHVNVPAVPVKASDMKKLVTAVEPVAVPVVQSPPAQASLQSPPAETWSDALPDNSSYATAESDESPATPPAGSTGGALTDDILLEATVPQASPAASEPPAAPVPAPDLVEVPAAPTVQASQDLTSPAPAAPAPAAAGSPKGASTAPAAEPKAHSAGPAAAAPVEGPATPAGLAVTCASCMDWLLRVYTYPVYLTVGAAVGLVTGMRDQLPGHSKAQHH